MKKFDLYQLNREEMKDVKGAARVCGCSCYYVGSGGSSVEGNGGANFGSGNNGAVSQKGDLQYIQCEW